MSDAGPAEDCRHASAHGDALRCACGSLLARSVPEGIELKCRRCKRTLVVPLEPEDGDSTVACSFVPPAAKDIAP